jgi:hypothetical protein
VFYPSKPGSNQANGVIAERAIVGIKGIHTLRHIPSIIFSRSAPKKIILDQIWELRPHWHYTVIDH